MILFEAIPEAQAIELKSLNRTHEHTIFGFAVTGAASMPFVIGTALTLEAMGVEGNWYLLALLAPLGTMAGFMLRGMAVERKAGKIERSYPDAVL